MLCARRSPLVSLFDLHGCTYTDPRRTDQRQRFLDEIVYFVNMTEVEQEIRMKDRSLTVDEYWHYRLGSSAVNLTSFMIE